MGPYESFANDYKKSRHFKPGDDVEEVVVRTTEYHTVEMALIVGRMDSRYRLSFWYDQSPEDEDYELASDDPDSYLDVMAGATEYTDAMNEADLHLYYD